jgi:peptide deformylase
VFVWPLTRKRSDRGRYPERVAAFPVRLYGDPVLKVATQEVTDIDGKIASLVDTMIETMYEANGVGLAANQIGVSKSVFVYDIGDGPITIVNPKIVESDGEWTFEEGCLSVPGLSWEITRPNAIHLIGLDLDGNEVSIETDEYEGRVFQHELDHLNGVVLLERLDDDQRAEAKKILRKRAEARSVRESGGLRGLFS